MADNVINVTGKIKEYLGSSEGIQTIKSIAGTSGSQTSRPTPDQVKEQVRAFLDSSEGKRFLGSAPSADSITSQIKSYLNSYEGKMAIGNLISESNNRLDVNSKIREFCQTESFRSCVLTALNNKTFWERVAEEALMLSMMKGTIERISPELVKAEIHRQVNEIIVEKFTRILTQELDKVIPHMVQVQCDKIVPHMVPSLVQTNMQSMLPPLVSTQVNYEMLQQFPGYLTNHPMVQNLINTQLHNISQTVQQTGDQVMNQIASNDAHNPLVKKHLDETAARCDREILNMRTKVEEQLKQNATVMQDQYTQHVNNMNSQTQGFQTYIDTQIQQKLTKPLADQAETIKLQASSLKDANKRTVELRSEVSFLKTGLGLMVLAVAFLGYVVWGMPKSVPAYKVI